MIRGLLLGADEFVAKWTWATFRIVPVKFDMAIGIIDPVTKDLVGAAILHWWNGPNIHMAYYGHKTLTLGIVRTLSMIILERFDPIRVTIHTRKTNKSIRRWLTRMGAKYEGCCHRYYGPADSGENVAVQYAVFRETLERITGGVKELSNGV